MRLVAGVASDEFFHAAHRLSQDMQRDPLLYEQSAKGQLDEILRGRTYVQQLGSEDKSDQPEAPWFQDGLISTADGLHWIQRPVEPQRTQTQH